MIHFSSQYVRATDMDDNYAFWQTFLGQWESLMPVSGDVYEMQYIKSQMIHIIKNSAVLFIVLNLMTSIWNIFQFGGI
jgi:hypothetical protein